MLASVFLVVKRRHAERNKAASEPKSKDAAQEANQPSECSFLLSHNAHSGLSAMLASALYWVLWPNVGCCRCCLILDNNDLALWCVLNRLSIWSILDWLSCWIWLWLCIYWLCWSHLLLVYWCHWLLHWLSLHEGLSVSLLFHA